MNTPDHSLLGKAIDYPIAYDPSLLFAIARADNRAALGLADALPFHGVDIWNAYELGWLDARGKPRVAMAEFRVPADSPKLIESKSFKPYLGSLAQQIGRAHVFTPVTKSHIVYRLLLEKNE